EGGDGLAAARLAYQPQRFAGIDLERHAVHGPRRARAVLGHEVGLQVAHAEQGLRHAASLCGSSEARSASPTAVCATKTRGIASPTSTRRISRASTQRRK